MDSDLFTKEDRERYKSISSSPPPPLEIQVLLSVPELTNNQVLVHLPPESSRVRIHPTPRFVLLETFVLDFVPGPPVDVPLPTIYKHGIPLFRSLYTLLRVLPAWKLHKRLRRRATASLGITLRLDELESLLSSRFLSLDQRPFTPTLAKTSGASSTSPPRSPPRQPSSLPRSLLGRQSITAAGAAMQAPPTPPTRAQALRQLPDSSTSSLSPSNSFYTPAPPPASASATGGGGDTQPQTRPTPRYPFPFKSNTVSSTAFPSSSSHGSVTALPSSLSERSNLSERIAQYERERVASFPHHPSDLSLSGSHSPSQSPLQRPVPLPLHARQTSLSVSRPTPLRDSPGTGDDPNASVSASASTSASASGARKRYSSSFGHRYTGPTPSPSTSSPAQQPQPQPQQRPGHTPSPSTSSPLQPQRSQRPSPVQLGGTGLGLLGLNSSPSPSPSSPHFTNRPVLAPSPGGIHPGTGASPSSPLYPIPRPPENRRSSIGMEVKTDEEDISIFVREIETRKPLVGRSRTGTPSASGEMISHSRSQSQPHSQLGPQWQSQSHALLEAQHGRSESRNGGSSGGQSGSGNFETRSPLRQSGAQVEAEDETEETNLPQSQAQLEARSPPSGLILTSEAEVDARLQRMNESSRRPH
ncbi:hypothetical protein H0H93_013727 [Arthromyces matolae]|nr:hypothetical protein H0H93_013727 [Arthromyces matolae]